MQYKLLHVSVLMKMFCYCVTLQGIPDDDIFGGFDDSLDDDNQLNNEVGVVSEVRESDVDDNLSLFSEGSERAGLSPRRAGHTSNRSNLGAKFSEKMVEVYQSPWQPSATPTHLQHRFMVHITLEKCWLLNVIGSPVLIFSEFSSANHFSNSSPYPSAGLTGKTHTH